MKNLKKVMCLCICFMMVSSFSLVAFADTCNSNPVITRTDKRCVGSTCYFAGTYAPHYELQETGYYQCWDNHGTPYTKPYNNTYRSGCC